MDQHILQANHNQEFHDCIEAQFRGRFFDWKITALFYVGLHYLRALAAMRGIDVGTTHVDVERSVNPDRHGAVMRISKGAWYDYKALWKYSQAARYDGFIDAETFQILMERDHQECLKHLARFVAYAKGQGLPL